MTITYPLNTPLSRNPCIAVTVLGAVSTITTILRFYALRLRGVKPGAPEWLIVAALGVVYVDIAIEFILTILGGAGRKMGEIDTSSVIITLKTILPLEALYGIVLGLVKTSIMLFYFRIFGTKQSFRISVFIVMAIVWAWSISVILETFLLCRPLAYNWDTTIPGGTCGNRNATYVVAGTMNLITDLLVMALPVPHIWKLQLNVAKKVALSSVFCLGLFTSIISIIRLVALMAIDFTDITYSVQMGVMWTVIEPELAIICANMPLLKAVLSKMAPGLFSTARTKYGASGPQSFERLQDPQYKNTHVLSRLDRGTMNTHLSTTRGTGEREGSEESIPDNFSDEQRLHNQPEHDKNGIRVDQNFVVKYGQ